MELGFSGVIDNLWTTIFPFFSEPEWASLSNVMDNPVFLESVKGNVPFFLLFVVMLVFNTFLGEEFLFRGILLPRMNGVFGKFDWLASGIFFSCYHFYQPWGILSGIIVSSISFDFFSRKYRSIWFGIILHSLQSLFFLIIVGSIVFGG